MLALFIWKDQKKQLELPEAKASIWPGIPPMCPTIDHGTLVPSAFHGAAPAHFLQNGSWPLQLFTESTTLISQALIVIIYSHPPVLRNCLPEHIIFFFFSSRSSANSWTSTFFLFETFLPPRAFLSVPRSGLMDKVSSRHHNTGVIWFSWESSSLALSCMCYSNKFYFYRLLTGVTKSWGWLL